MKKKFKNSKQISKLNINLRLFLDFSFPLLLFFYYSLENCENLSFEYFQSFYNGQLVNWKIQKAIPFSYENMSIYHNTSVAIANRTIDSKYVLNSGWLKAKVYCPSDCHLISNSTYTIIPDTIVSKFAGFGSLSQYVDVNHPPDYKRFRVASETGTIVGSCDNLIAIGHMWVFVFGHFVLDVLPSMLFIPENVRNTSKLLLTINSTMYKEYYYAMGFRDDQFVFIENDQFLYVQQLQNAINQMHKDWEKGQDDKKHGITREMRLAEERKKKEEAERKAREAEEERKRAAEERKRLEEEKKLAAKKAKEEAERKAKEEKERKAREEAERKAKEEKARTASYKDL